MCLEVFVQCDVRCKVTYKQNPLNFLFRMRERFRGPMNSCIHQQHANNQNFMFFVVICEYIVHINSKMDRKEQWVTSKAYK